MVDIENTWEDVSPLPTLMKRRLKKFRRFFIWGSFVNFVRVAGNPTGRDIHSTKNTPGLSSDIYKGGDFMKDKACKWTYEKANDKAKVCWNSECGSRFIWPQFRALEALKKSATLPHDWSSYRDSYEGTIILVHRETVWRACVFQAVRACTDPHTWNTALTAVIPGESSSSNWTEWVYHYRKIQDKL